MANPQHVELVHKGQEWLDEWFESNPNERLDLRGADFRGRNFVEYTFRYADLTGAQFDRCTFTTTTFFKCDLTEATFTHATVVQTNTDPKLRFVNCQLDNADFSRLTSEGAVFAQSRLIGAKFHHATMTRVRFEEADLAKAEFDGADMRECAILGTATKCAASFSQARLIRATFTHVSMAGADIAGADCYEAQFYSCDLSGIVGADSARNLHTCRLNTPSQYFENATVWWPNKLASWERIRVFGNLPLFAVSYSALVLIPAYLYFVAWYNEELARIKKFPGVTPDWAARHELTIPSLTWLLFFSTLFLAAASTLYRLFCPSRVSTFTRDVWVDQLDKSLLHYWPLSWWYFWVRIPCMVLYVIGGAGALIVLVVKVWNAGAYIQAHSPW